jgi:hypothetical protein
MKQKKNNVMKSKIFKSILYTIMMVLGIHGLASSQGLPPEKEKELEIKMQQMEAKLKTMQQKLDSMKVRVGVIKGVKINGNTYNTQDFVALKGIPFTSTYSFSSAAPLSKLKGSDSMVYISEDGNIRGGGKVLTMTGSGNISAPMQGLKRSLNYDFDNKIEEKIKNGEVKEKTKNYSKSYPVNRGDKLMIDNQFGKVTVNTWNKNEFKVDVEIKGLANNDDEAQKLLDGASVIDSKDNGVITFTTQIIKQGNYTWGSSTENGNITFHVRKLEVNYTVYMPSKNSLEIKNRFGAVTIPDFGGKLLINTQYGTFTAKELTNTENEISTRFTDVNIGSIIGSSMSCQYGNSGNGVKIGNANNLKLDAQFVNVDISKIKSSGDISVKYGDGLIITDLDKNLKTLNINSSFAPITMGSKSNNNFDFSVAVKKGSDFKYDDNRVKITSKTPDNERRYNPIKTYVGYTGKGNSDTKVTINSSYKGVQFL